MSGAVVPEEAETALAANGQASFFIDEQIPRHRYVRLALSEESSQG